MSMSLQGDGCKGCAISRQDCGVDLVRRVLDNGGIVPLRGNWILHHYVGTEGFLGWLALQPREHRECLSDLTSDEWKEFGEIVKAIENGLVAYWKEEFPKDPLERVYVACFYESSREHPHLHLHLVPRPRSFMEDLHLCAVTCSASKEIDRTTRPVYGWHIHLATKCPGFPERYRRVEQKSRKLIEFLKTKLPLA